MSNNKPGAKHQEILIESAQLTSSAHGIAAVWLTASFAREWFNDAVHEARTGGDIQAKRREIVFAVSFAESYLFEWVRDQVLDTGDLEQLVSDLECVMDSRRG
jgi:hypothetical protein